MPRLLFVPLLAALALPAAAQQQPSCGGDEHRQFDFWLGTWDVFRTSDGARAGTNTITMVLNGCALHEHWESLSSAYRGSSYNAYDRARGQWHQTWIDTGGLVLKLDGGMQDGRMVMSGFTVGQNGAETLNRVTWTPNRDGTVRQVWETSSDSGTTWSVAFDGRYVKRR